MAAYVFVEHCVMGTPLYAVTRNAHMEGFTHHACLLVVLPSPKNGTALTALDYHSLRDIPGRNLVSRSKPKLMH